VARLTVLRRHSRSVSALVGILYAIVCFTISFQHTDCFAEEAAALGARPGSFTSVLRSPHSRAEALRVAPRASASAGHHCLACDWQSAQVSPALRPLTAMLGQPKAPRSSAALPAPVRLRVARSASRAPPAA
jgi:hypothetical protein